MWRYVVEIINLLTYFILLVFILFFVGIRFRDFFWFRFGVFLVVGFFIFVWEGSAFFFFGGLVSASIFDGFFFSFCFESGSVLDGFWFVGFSGLVFVFDLVGKFFFGFFVSWNIYIFNYSIFVCYNITYWFSII